MSKRPGQPTKYKPEYCQLLIEHMEKGFSFESFAGKISVNRDTIYEWAKVHPEFSDAKKEGRSKSLLYHEAVMLQGIRGKIKNFNAATQIFLMKNCFNWTDRNQIEHAGTVSLHAQLVQALNEGDE